MPVNLEDIPTRGLIEVLSSWALAGSVTPVEALIEALAAVPQVAADREWSSVDVRQRAERVAREMLEPSVLALPEHEAVWLERLPAVSDARRRWSDAPVPPVDWLATVRRAGGWPPTNPHDVKYRRLHRRRRRDDAVSRCLSWCRSTLMSLLLSDKGMSEATGRALKDRVGAIPDLVPNSGLPTASDLGALRALGYPFTHLRDIAQTLATLATDPVQYAYRLVMPDNELRWRLFHLGCYGEVLAELTARVGRVASTRPLSGGGRRPNHVLRVPSGTEYHLWFEAGGIWRHYGTGHTTHLELSRAVSPQAGGLSPDIVVGRVDSGQLTRLAVGECKYSSLASYTFGDGYTQAVGYAMEAVREFRIPVITATIPPSVASHRATYADTVVAGLSLHAGVSDPASFARSVAAWLIGGLSQLGTESRLI